MALLAQPKKKQKLGIDPNNTKWANDSSAFGHTLLKRMGWTEGRGLGANEDGRTAPVKASMKIDNRGLGCTPQDADSWIAHQDGFNELLAMLNNADKTDGQTTPEQTSKIPEGARRFYDRFSRGGVKRLRTTEDLDSILGRRKSAGLVKIKSKEEIKEEQNSETIKEESISEDSNEEKTHGFVTVTSSCSVQDYFAKKMKEKKISVPSFSKDENEKENNNTSEEPKKEAGGNSYVISSLSVQGYFEQKKKLKKAHLSYQGEHKQDVDKENGEATSETEHASTYEDSKSHLKQGEKQKKRQKKMRENKSEEIVVEHDGHDVAKKKRKKEKKKNYISAEEKNTVEKCEVKEKSKRKKCIKVIHTGDNCNGNGDSEINKEDKHSEHDCGSIGISDSRASTSETKNAKKKLKYKAKMIILKKLELLKNVNYREEIAMMNSMSYKTLTDLSNNEAMRQLRVKILDKTALLNSSESKSNKKKMKVLSKQIKELKQVYSDNVAESKKKLCLELETLQKIVLKKVKRKVKENVVAINTLKTNEESNMKINWMDAIGEVKSLKEKAVKDLSVKKEEIIQSLDKMIGEAARRIKELENNEIVKTDEEAESSLFPGATDINGYIY